MGALYQTKVQVSYAFGICIASLVVEDRRGSGDTPGDLLKGLRAALWMDAGFARGPYV